MEHKQSDVVVSIRPYDHRKEVLMPRIGSYLLPKSACISESQAVFQDHDNGIWAINDNRPTMIHPSYAEVDTLRIGAVELGVMAKEITEANESDATDQLLDLHYKKAKTVGGKVAKIIIRSCHPSYPVVLGVTILSAVYRSCKPRNDLLNRKLPGYWDKFATGQNQHSSPNYRYVTRFARTVVHPEFRACGVAGLLKKYGIDYAAKRFNDRGSAPLFIESIAMMQKFIPSSRRHMTYVGHTKGGGFNSKADIKKMLDGKEDDIYTDDKTAIQHLKALQDKMGWSNAEALTKYELASRGDHRYYKHFAVFIQKPIPVYMTWLMPEHEQWFNDRVEYEKVGLENTRRPGT